jgi:hypothetical protein
VCGLRSSSASCGSLIFEQVRAVILLRYPGALQALHSTILRRTHPNRRRSTPNVVVFEHRPRFTTLPIIDTVHRTYERFTHTSTCYCTLDLHDISFIFSPLLLHICSLRRQLVFVSLQLKYTPGVGKVSSRLSTSSGGLTTTSG